MFMKKGGPQATFFAVEIFESLTGSFAVNSAQDDECAGSASSN